MKNLLTTLLLLLLLSSCSKESKTCDPGFTGTNCDQQKTPSNIVINSVTVTSFPATDNGAGWDLTSGPDCYLSILHNGVELFNSESTFIQNATGSLVIPVNLPISSVTDFYTFGLFDYDDFDANDYLGGVQGVLYESTNGFPTSVLLNCGACAVSFSVSVDYTF